MLLSMHLYLQKPMYIRSLHSSHIPLAQRRSEVPEVARKSHNPDVGRLRNNIAKQETQHECRKR